MSEILTRGSLVGFRVEGGAELAAALRSLSTRMSRQILREALAETIGEPVRRRASVLAPTDPGAPDLAQHIVMSPSRGKAGDAALAVGPSKEGRGDQASRTFDLQAWFVEYGTVHRDATPFLRPAFSEAPGRLGALGQALWRELAGRGISRPTGEGGSVGDSAFGSGTSGLGAGQFTYKVRGTAR